MDQEITDMKKINDSLSDVVSLNISGKSKTQVSRKLLTSVPYTLLEAMFSGRH